MATAVATVSLLGASEAPGHMTTTPQSPRSNAAVQPRAKVFVSTTGSDQANCSRVSPCKTFDRAYRVAQPGQVVEVAGGTYGSQTIGADSSRGSADDVVF